MVTKILLDSDILIDYLRIKTGPLPSFLDLQKNGEAKLFISAVSIMEIFTGKSAGEIADELESFITSFQVVSFDKEIARFAGEIERNHKLKLPVSDFIIGVTSLRLKAQLATRNKKHFQGIPGLKFFSPS